MSSYYEVHTPKPKRKKPPAVKPPTRKLTRLGGVTVPTPRPSGAHVNDLPGGWLGASAADQTQQQINPQLKYIADHYSNLAQQAASDIGGATDTYAGLLEPLAGQTRAYYNTAIKNTDNTSAGVKTSIMNTGRQAALSLATSLQQAGLPTNAGGTDIDLGAMGAGASEAAYQLGQAAVEQMRKSGAAAVDYASKLPGFARMEGAYNTQGQLSVLAARMADEEAQTAAQAPQLYYQIYNDLQDRQDAQVQAEQQAAADAAKQAYGESQDTLRQSNSDRTFLAGQAASLTKNSSHQYGVTVKNGKYVVTDLGPKSQKAGTPAKPTKPYHFKGTDGRTYQQNPDGTATPISGQSGPKVSTPKSTKPYHFKGTNGLTYQVGPDGVATPIAGQSPPKPPKGAKGSTPKTVFGTAPHKRNDGVWVTHFGVPLSDAAAKYWANLLTRGLTDGAGHLTKPTRKQAAGGSSSSSSSGTTTRIRKKAS